MYALGRECGVDETMSRPAKKAAACSVEAIWHMPPARPSMSSPPWMHRRDAIAFLLGAIADDLVEAEHFVRLEDVAVELVGADLQVVGAIGVEADGRIVRLPVAEHRRDVDVLRGPRS